MVHTSDAASAAVVFNSRNMNRIRDGRIPVRFANCDGAYKTLNGEWVGEKVGEWVSEWVSVWVSG